MPPAQNVLLAATSIAVVLACAAGCDQGRAASLEAESDAQRAAAATSEQPDPYVDYPLHGLVTGLQLSVRKQPAPDALVLGWLRKGELIRLKPDAKKTTTCASGWYPIHPVGFACAGEGIDISKEPPQIAEEDRMQARRDQAMPYQYYLVKDPKVPEYHQPPSRDQQRAAAAYADMWLKLERGEDKRKLALFLEGKLPGQPARHAAVRRFLERGFYVASTGTTVRSRRRFAHTVRGSYVKEQQLDARSGPAFHGVELNETRKLPVAWAVRTAVPQLMRTHDAGTVRLVDAPDKPPIERLSVVEGYVGTQRAPDGKVLHVLPDDTYLRHWFLAVAKPIDRPKEVGDAEVWVHVSLAEQTLVLYRGDTPLYATLVSSGLPDHATQAGSFRIQRKFVSDTMSDIGADAADDRYSIDDVPWTQYFDGARALHGAFWHAQFGMQRSHGCVNLAPADARYVFRHTEPQLPAGWHGISTQQTGFKGSLVLVTE